MSDMQNTEQPTQQDMPQTPAPDAEPKMVVLDEKTFNLLKLQLIERVRTMYGEFIVKLSSVPMHDGLRNIARGHLDTGFLWYKEAAEQLPKQQLESQIQVVPPSPTPDAGETDPA